MRVTIQAKILAIFIALTVIPLGILGFLALKDAHRLGIGASNNARSMGSIVVDKINTSITNMVGESFVRQGQLISESVVKFLAEREIDTVSVSTAIGEYLDNSKKIENFLLKYQNEKQKEVWFNSGTDLAPINNKELKPIYSQVLYIDETGQEIVKIINGTVSSKLKNVSLPENTEFKDEEYFNKTKGLSANDVYVSRVNTWYTSQEEARKKVPQTDKDNKGWNIVPERDTQKEGNIRFASPVYNNGVFRGIVVLSVDYQHLQGLTKHIDPATNERVVSTPYEGNYILFFDDEGNTIVHPKPNNVIGYLNNGKLEHTNTTKTPGGIFNLRDYDKNDSYNKIYNAAVINKETLVTSATDVRGRNKMTVTIPVPYNKGEYKEKGVFGGLMLSVNTDNFYNSVEEASALITSEVNKTESKIRNATENLGTQNTIFLITLITIIATILIGTIFARSLTVPIKQLTAVGKEISNGNTDVKVPEIKTKDEIKDLADSFQSALAAISFLMEESNKKNK